MKRVISIFGKEFDLPFIQKISNVIKSFSLSEKIIFSLCALIFISVTFSMLLQVNNQFLVEIPRQGGELREGVVGTPRFINPLLALSETDRDISSLVYSGLMRSTPDGKLIPDLASEYSISEDGTSYNFIIRDDAIFHDGTPVTSDDVIFTILSAQDSTIKSPKRANWDGVRIERVNDKELTFFLEQPYSPFLSNTTLGILPKHLWQAVSSDEFAFSQLNTNPIGSGPYEIAEIISDKSGIATSYILDSFDKFTLGKPHIESVIFKFYRNESALTTALERNEIDSLNSISPDYAEEISDNYVIKRFPLPRIFGVFFNQSQAPILSNKTVRRALNESIDRQQLIDDVLNGYAREINSPIPSVLSNFEEIISSEENQITSEQRIESAKQILSEGGWELNESGILQRESSEGLELLTFDISTADVPELVAAAEHIVSTWRALGADVNVKVFNPNDLNQNVIRPRRYDALLFGEVIGQDLDFYAFWHSSQRNDPGLNIADYANITADRALEKARELPIDSVDRIEQLKIFEKEISTDIPAIFIYSPDFIYVVPKNLKGVVSENITIPSDRFSTIYDWYLETDRVWKIFN